MRRAINRVWAMCLALAIVPAAPASAADKSHPPAPLNNPAAWFTNDDYPAAARRAMQQGRVAIAVSVDATGQITGCTVTASSGSAVLDQATCDLVRKRGKFKPALDQDGRAVAGVYPIATRWALADDPDPIPTDRPWRAGAIVSIDSTGKPIACRQDEDGSRDTWTPFPCRAVSTLPEWYGLFTRSGLTGSAPVDVTFEASITGNGVAPPPMAYTAPGRTVLSKLVLHLDIGADGKVMGCKVLADSGTSGWTEPCTRPFGTFSPSLKPVGIDMTVAVSRAGG